MIDKRTENKAVKEMVKGFIEIIEDPITKEVSNHLNPYKKPTTEDEWRELCILQANEMNKLYDEFIEQCDSNPDDPTTPALRRIVEGILNEYMPNPDIAEMLKAKYEVGQDLMERFNVLNGIDESSFVWSKPFRMFLHGKQKNFEVSTPYKKPDSIGVYKIIHKPTNEIVYIGKGNNVGGRLGRHRGVFLNKGKDMKNPGGTTNPSVVGQHMYKYDSRKSNWLCSFMITKNEDIALKAELQLQEKYRPMFNSITLAGVKT